MPLPFDPTELAMLTNNGYFGVPEDRLIEIVNMMAFGNMDMFSAAWACDIDPANLDAGDYALIQGYYEAIRDCDGDGDAPLI